MTPGVILWESERITPDVLAVGRVWLGCPAGQLQELLVLVADEFDHLRAVGHDLLLYSDGERPRVRLRIVNRDVDLQLSEVHAPEPFGQLQRVGERVACSVEPSITR